LILRLSPEILLDNISLIDYFCGSYGSRCFLIGEGTMEINLLPVKSMALLDLNGEFLAEDFQPLYRRIIELLKQGMKKIAINLELVPRFAPEAIDQLVKIRIDVEKFGGALRLFNPNRDLEIALRRVGLEHLIVLNPLHKKAEEAPEPAEIEPESPPSVELVEASISEAPPQEVPPKVKVIYPQPVPLSSPKITRPISVVPQVKVPPPIEPLSPLTQIPPEESPVIPEVESIEAPRIFTPPPPPPIPTSLRPAAVPVPPPREEVMVPPVELEPGEAWPPKVVPLKVNTYYIVILSVDQKVLERFYFLMDRYGQERMIKGKDSKSLFEGDRSVMFIDYYLENNVKTIQLKIRPTVTVDIRTLWGFKKHHIIWELIARDMNGFILVLPSIVTDAKLRAMQDLFKFFASASEMRIPHIVCVPDTLGLEASDRILMTLGIGSSIPVYQFSENDSSRIGSILEIFTESIQNLEIGIREMVEPISGV